MGSFTFNTLLLPEAAHIFALPVMSNKNEATPMNVLEGIL